MVQWKLIGLESPGQWAAELHRIPHGFAHTWEHCFAMHRTTGYRTLLACGSNGHHRVVCPLVERRWEHWIDIATPFGFNGFTGTGEITELASDWKRFAASQGYVCGYIGLNPFLERDWFFDPAEVYSDNSLYLLDLERSEDQILAAMARHRRHQIRGGLRTGADFVDARASISEFLLRAYPEFLERVQASSASQFSADTIEFLCQQKNVVALAVKSAGRVTAAYLFTYTAYMADCFLNVSLPEGRTHTTALLWRGIQELRARGVPRLNMGGGVREGDSIACAKQRFGGKRTPFLAIKQVYRPDLYENLCRDAGVDPADRRSFFPAYRAPRMPQASPE